MICIDILSSARNAGLDALMEEFIARENIRRFRAQLDQCADEAQRGTLQRLLKDEESRLEEIIASRARP